MLDLNLSPIEGSQATLNVSELLKYMDVAQCSPVELLRVARLQWHYVRLQLKAARAGRVAAATAAARAARAAPSHSAASSGSRSWFDDHAIDDTELARY